MSSSTPNHPFHMVKPSAWPFIGSIGALSMAVGAILYFTYGNLWTVLPGFLIVLYTMYGWWSDVTKEGQTGDHTSTVAHGLRMGMILFIVSEVMFFFAFFWAFFDRSVVAINRTAHTQWPPEGITVFDPWGLPFINTLILLTSGATVTVAHHAIQKGDHKKTATWLFLTFVLGFIFLGTQAYEYSLAPFGFTDGIFPSTFFLATGFHGFHVLVGSIFLLVCWLRVRKGHMTAEQHVGFEAAAWYWHFVDVVWLFLFVSVYWWGGFGAPVAAH